MSEVLVLNPRRRRTRKAKATHKRHRRRKRSVRRAHALNPRHHRRRRRNPVMRHRRRRRRNPSLRGAGNMLMQGVAIGVAAKGVNVLAKMIAAKLPASWQANANVVRIGTKAALSIGAPMLLKRFKVLPGNIVTAIQIGGLAITVLDVIDTYVTPHVPFLQGYEDGTITGYEAGTLTGADDAPQIGAGAYDQGAY